ncbi:MAG TPA: hypothetical protein ENK31_08820 [Nannocystis exedens]|nr:hypothetical protein [Nannocystis exedens]
MRALASLVVLCALAALSLTCGGLVEAEVDDYCLENPDACPACASDDACVFMGNACTDQVVCAHVDTDLVFVQIGCSEAQERRWPQDEACACVEQVCQSGLDGDF